MALIVAASGRTRSPLRSPSFTIRPCGAPGGCSKEKGPERPGRFAQNQHRSQSCPHPCGLETVQNVPLLGQDCSHPKWEANSTLRRFFPQGNDQLPAISPQFLVEFNSWRVCFWVQPPPRRCLIAAVGHKAIFNAACRASCHINTVFTLI
jgi:hypothetical protein